MLPLTMWRVSPLAIVAAVARGSVLVCGEVVLLVRVGATVRVRVRVRIRVRVGVGVGFGFGFGFGVGGRGRVGAHLRDVGVPQPVARAAPRCVLKLGHALQARTTYRRLLEGLVGR